MVDPPSLGLVPLTELAWVLLGSLDPFRPPAETGHWNPRVPGPVGQVGPPLSPEAAARQTRMDPSQSWVVVRLLPKE